jgi:hypothetical protein
MEKRELSEKEVLPGSLFILRSLVIYLVNVLGWLVGLVFLWWRKQILLRLILMNLRGHQLAISPVLNFLWIIEFLLIDT